MNYDEISVIKEVKELMVCLGIETFPSRPQLEIIQGLLTRVGRVGGSRYLSEKYNIQLKKRRVKWDNEKIKEEIIKVQKTLNINRFPTREEIDKTTKSTALSNKISKTGGWRVWADLCGLDLKECDTLTGNIGEDEIRDLLISKGYETIDMTTCAAYDLLINKNIRVDVKVSHLYHGINGNFYACSFGKKFHNCDLFIVKLIHDNDEEEVLIIPVKEVEGQSQISIGEFKSKWYKYKDRYDLIDAYDNFYKMMA